MNLIEDLIQAIELLDNIDNEYEKIPKMQSEIDSKLSDVYHFIENNHLNTSQRYRIVSLIIELRCTRRKINNEWELLRTFKNNENKLSNQNNRRMLLSEVHKRAKNLNLDYKYRIYTEEELRGIVGD